jgi:YVTN family beta-propeller protein
MGNATEQEGLKMRITRFVLATSALVCLSAAAMAAQNAPPVLLVLEKQDKTMAIVDPASASVLARVPVGNDPHEVVVSPDGKTAFVSNYGGPGSAEHTISVVDLVARKALAPIDLGIFHSAHGLFIAADGELYFTAETNKVIGRYNLATHAIDWILGTGQNRTHMLEVAKDLEHIYIANVASGTIGIIDKTDDLHVAPPPGSPGAAPVPGFAPPPQPANPPPKPPPGWNVTIIPTGDGVEGFDVSPDGKELWAANANIGTVSIIDLATKKVKQTLTFPGTVLANRLRFTPDGKTVLISYLRSGELISVDVASRKLIKRLPVGGGAAGILLSPDGQTAYVGVGRDNKVTAVDIKTMTVKQEIPVGRGADGMAWAPATP